MPQAHTGPGGRWYIRPSTGVSYPSVTTFLDTIAKPFLIPWAAKVTAEYVADHLIPLAEMDRDTRVKDVKERWNEVRMQAADHGTAVHEFADHVLTYGRAPKSIELTHSHRNVLAALDALQPTVLASEQTVVQETVGYMGTLDGIWNVAGERWLIDWKSGKRLWPEYALQLTAYAQADYLCMDDEGDEIPMPQMDRLVLLHVPQDGPWSAVNVTTGLSEWLTVQAAHAVFMWSHGAAKTVLGAPRTLERQRKQAD